MKILLNFLYFLLWLLAIGFFMVIGYNIINHEIELTSISALAILISAFLASLSVLKSINFSDETNKISNLNKKNTNIVFLDFILLDIYRQIIFIQNEFLHLAKRHEKLIQNRQPNCQVVDDADEYILNLVLSRKTQLINRVKQLEDKDILYSLDEGQRIVILKISNDIYTITDFFDHIIYSKNTKVFNSFLTDNQEIFSRVLKLIEVLKNDFEKEYPNIQILSTEEFLNEHKA